MKPLHTVLLGILMTGLATSSALPQQTHHPRATAGISQLIEERAGRTSCWGVVIWLGETRFKGRISKEQIEIRDGKHGRELKEMMTWRVERAGKRLVIAFKRGMGDFGSGNSVEVRIDRTAFVEPVTSPNHRFEWSLDTDIL